MHDPAAPRSNEPNGGANIEQAQRATPQPARTLCSDELLQGGRSVAIRHNGAVYRLQATKQGKLILTK
jgi:hemin uptake protein HemP